MTATIIRLVLGIFCLFFALLASTENTMAAVIMAALAGGILWPLLRGPK